jgi:hypothetical protein
LIAKQASSPRKCFFQIDTYIEDAESREFSIWTPVRMSKDYGASIYSAVRQYVSKHSKACAVLVLNPPELVEGDGFRATLRRHIESSPFVALVGQIKWPDTFTPADRIGAMVPVGTRKYSGKRQIPLTDMNGDTHECLAEAFTQGHQVFVLIHAVKTLASKTVLLRAS